jgi:hypothetical protein
VYVVDTEDETSFPEMESILLRANELADSLIFHNMNPILKNEPLSEYKGQDYGYVLTDLVMEYLLQRRADPSHSKECEFMMVTNGDNLYGSGLFHAVGNKIQEGYNLIGMHFVSHYDGTAAEYCGRHRDGQDQEIDARFEANCIDLGAVVFASQIVERWNIRFAINDMRQNIIPNFSIADGVTFVNMLHSKGANAIIIPRVLLLHQ